jgi:hypothetical protein
LPDPDGPISETNSPLSISAETRSSEGVLVECASLLVVAQRVEVDVEVMGGGESVGVAVAEYAAGASEGVLVECARLLGLAQCA